MTRKFTINNKEVEFEYHELNDTLGQTICLINILGEKYWNECKKVFTINEKIKEKIDNCFI